MESCALKAHVRRSVNTHEVQRDVVDMHILCNSSITDTKTKQVLDVNKNSRSSKHVFVYGEVEEGNLMRLTLHHQRIIIIMKKNEIKSEAKRKYHMTSKAGVRRKKREKNKKKSSPYIRKTARKRKEETLRILLFAYGRKTK